VNQAEKNEVFMRLLGEIETTIPVDEWQVDSVRAWPIARTQLYYGFFEYQFFQNQPARAGLITAADLPRLGRRIGASAFNFVKASLTDFAGTHHRDRPHDALFLNYQTYMTPINGRWYSRICDPFVDELAARGWSSFMLTGGYEYSTPRFRKSRFIQPQLVAYRLMAMARPRPNREPPAMLRHIETRARASGLFSDSFRLIEPVRRQAMQITSIARYFRRVLEAVRPKIVLVTCWYATESMACVLACDQLGIPTVDIQHGSQESHFAYDRWNRVPAGGYELVPDFFWCWSETEAAVIRNWVGDRSVHQPIVGGNLFLERWVSANDDMVRGYDKLLTEMKQRNGAKVQILYTLNGSTKQEIATIVDIVNAVNSSGLDAFFWIRLHPIALNQGELVSSALAAQGLRNVEVEQSTRLPLYAILRHMDLHVTEFSSVVIEAQSFGVPSVTGEQGVIWFPQQVATGWAVMARSIPEWVSGIATQLERRQSLQSSRPPRVSAAAGLEALLRTAVKPVPERSHAGVG
jgi:hypothetical protein